MSVCSLRRILSDTGSARPTLRPLRRHLMPTRALPVLRSFRRILSDTAPPSRPFLAVSGDVIAARSDSVYYPRIPCEYSAPHFVHCVGIKCRHERLFLASDIIRHGLCPPHTPSIASASNADTGSARTSFISSDIIRHGSRSRPFLAVSGDVIAARNDSVYYPRIPCEYSAPHSVHCVGI